MERAPARRRRPAVRILLPGDRRGRRRAPGRGVGQPLLLHDRRPLLGGARARLHGLSTAGAGRSRPRRGDRHIPLGGDEHLRPGARRLPRRHRRQRPLHAGNPARLRRRGSPHGPLQRRILVLVRAADQPRPRPADARADGRQLPQSGDRPHRRRPRRLAGARRLVRQPHLRAAHLRDGARRHPAGQPLDVCRAPAERRRRRVRARLRRLRRGRRGVASAADLGRGVHAPEGVRQRDPLLLRPPRLGLRRRAHRRRRRRRRSRRADRAAEHGGRQRRRIRRRLRLGPRASTRAAPKPASPPPCAWTKATAASPANRS